MGYKTAKVYSGSEWVDLAVTVADSTQRIVSEVGGVTYTPVLVDAGKILVFTNSSSVAFTIPAESTTNYLIGQTIKLVQRGTGQVTISGAVGVTLRSLAGNTKTSGQYASVDIVKIASNEWLLSGNLSS